MGQYYRPVLLSENGVIIGTALAHDYDNGLKLMEHSWLGNNFVDRIVTEIIDNPTKIVWAGDYAKREPNSQLNLYGMTNHAHDLPKKECKIDYKVHRYLVNHDSEQYVDMTKLPVSEVWEGTEYRIHPLPLLTCEGNGNGGGDYYSKKRSMYLGKWARCHVSVESSVPEGFKRINPNFKENN